MGLSPRAQAILDKYPDAPSLLINSVLAQYLDLFICNGNATDEIVVFRGLRLFAEMDTMLMDLYGLSSRGKSRAEIAKSVHLEFKKRYFPEAQDIVNSWFLDDAPISDSGSLLETWVAARLAHEGYHAINRTDIYESQIAWARNPFEQLTKAQSSFKVANVDSVSQQIINVVKINSIKSGDS